MTQGLMIGTGKTETRLERAALHLAIASPQEGHPAILVVIP